MKLRLATNERRAKRNFSGEMKLINPSSLRALMCTGPNRLQFRSLSITKIWSLICGLRYWSFSYEII